jgi:hypothetical protein
MRDSISSNESSAREAFVQFFNPAFRVLHSRASAYDRSQWKRSSSIRVAPRRGSRWRLQTKSDVYCLRKVACRFAPSRHNSTKPASLPHDGSAFFNDRPQGNPLSHRLPSPKRLVPEELIPYSCILGQDSFSMTRRDQALLHCDSISVEPRALSQEATDGLIRPLTSEYFYWKGRAFLE